MLTRYEALDMGKFLDAVETAIATSPENAPDAGVIYIAHAVNIDDQWEGAVVSYGKKVYTHEDHSLSLAQFYQSLLDDGKIGNAEQRAKIAVHAMTGNPVNDIIQIASGLHRREMELKAGRAAS